MIKMKLVPAEATEEMAHAATGIVPTWDDIISRKKFDAMLEAAPHGGKVSKEAFEKACDAAYDSFMKGSGGTNSVARAVIEALGLEIDQ